MSIKTKPSYRTLVFAHVLALACVLIAGCASLPRITPDMARADHVQLQGAKGPLSVDQSKAVIEQLKGRGPETDIFNRHLAVEEALVGSPLTVGNKVTLLEDGPTTFKHMYAAIRAARDRIDVESYIFEPGDIGDRMREELIARRKHGVQVHVIYDGVGSLGTPQEFFKAMTDAGIEVLQFNPVNPLASKRGWDVNQRDHRKLLVIDGRVVFVGGINISSVYSSGSRSGSSLSGGSSPQDVEARHRKENEMPWRDTHVEIEGPVAAEFEKSFAAMWHKQTGQDIPGSGDSTTQTKGSAKGSEVVRAIASGPDQPYSEMYATLISALNSAESTIHFTMAYFVPDPQFVAALKAAVARGVDVKIVLPGKTDSALVFYAARSYYGDLIEAGIKIYERRDALLHAKTGVIDGVWSTIGSTNLDWRSFLHNYELNAVVLGSGFGGQMEAMFARDETDSELITLERWKKRSLLERIKERGARLWAYWL